MRTTVLLLALVVASSLAPAPARAEPHWQAFESFEDTFGAWSADSHVGCEGQPGCVFEWLVEPSKDEARDGDFSLLTIGDGSNDDGTIWMERSLAEAMLDPGDYVVTVGLWFWSPSDLPINRQSVVAYAGMGDPEAEQDFTILGETNVQAGWAYYEGAFPLAVPEITVTEPYAAFGWTITWEGTFTFYMDAVTVTVEKAEA